MGAVAIVALALWSAASGPAAAQQGVDVLRDLPYASGGGARTFDAFVPPGAGPFPAVVFVHGGAYAGGGKEGLAAPASQVARNGWVGITIDFRLEQPGWPTQVEDVRAAISFVRENAATLKVDPSAIALVGASSGANLALLAGMSGEGDLTTGPRVRAVVSWSGPTDLEALATRPEGPPGSCSPATCQRRRQTAAVLERYVGCPVGSCAQEYRAASPTSHVDPSDPPALLANGTDELIPLEQATGMAETLRGAGVPVEVIEVPGSLHGTEFGRDVWPQTLAFLSRWLVELPQPAPGGSGTGANAAAAIVVALALLAAAAARRRRRRSGP